jgi:hypothetical protein
VRKLLGNVKIWSKCLHLQIRVIRIVWQGRCSAPGCVGNGGRKKCPRKDRRLTRREKRWTVIWHTRTEWLAPLNTIRAAQGILPTIIFNIDPVSDADEELKYTLIWGDLKRADIQKGL